MLIFLCAVVSKTLIFLTFSLFCQNFSTLSAIIYYLSDICIIQGFNLWKIATFLTGFHVIKIKRNKSNDCFWPFRPVLVASGMAGEKTAHRPPSRLAPSPPSKIKAPWRFFTRPGKNPSLSEIPYQSPKKCLKTQITTFSILKFSPKTKNTPVLTVFTLFLPFYHHPVVCSIVFLLLLSSHCHYYHPAAFAFLKISQDKIYQTLSCICPVNWHFEVPRRAVRFWNSANYHAQSPTKAICSEVFFLGLFWFFKVFFCNNCFGLFCSTFTIHHLSFTISFISAWFLLSFFLSFP